MLSDEIEVGSSVRWESPIWGGGVQHYSGFVVSLRDINAGRVALISNWAETQRTELPLDSLYIIP